MKNRCRKIVFFLCAVVIGCATPTISGRLSTIPHRQLPQGATFSVLMPSDTPSVTEATIARSVAQCMESSGYRKSDTPKSADLAVAYSFSVGAGEQVVTSSPDFVTGGHSISSMTVYPRLFQITIIDFKTSQLPDRVDVIWQGEVFSKGSSVDMAEVGPYFIQQICSNLGLEVTNKWFQVKVRR